MNEETEREGGGGGETLGLSKMGRERKSIYKCITSDCGSFRGLCAIYLFSFLLLLLLSYSLVDMTRTRENRTGCRRERTTPLDPRWNKPIDDLLLLFTVSIRY